jgi:hypothetical protein
MNCRNFLLKLSAVAATAAVPASALLGTAIDLERRDRLRLPRACGILPRLGLGSQGAHDRA